MSELSRIDWSTVTLSVGQHAPGAQPPAMNVMEAHTVRRGQAWSAAPADVSPVVRVFCLTWQDTPAVPDGLAIRAELLRRELAGQFDDTHGSIRQERHRALVALDWLIRTHTVAWLQLVPALVAHAERLASVPPLAQPSSDVGAIEEVVYDARDAAYDTEAYDAPGVVDRRRAAWTAERAAIWSAVNEAVWTAIRAAAGEAAANAAREQAGPAAVHASLEASWIAAAYGARAAAARVAAEPAAARTAVQAVLQPTVKRLQASAWALLDRLCAPGEQVAPPVESLEADAGEA